jgi:hypothetical protein
MRYSIGEVEDERTSKMAEERRTMFARRECSSMCPKEEMTIAAGWFFVFEPNWDFRRFSSGLHLDHDLFCIL